MAGSLKAFWTSELGAASTRKGFLLAAICGVIVISGYLVASGGQAPGRSSTPTADAVVLARLTSGQIRSFDAPTIERRLALFTDPTEFTDTQLRNAHRTWARRAIDRSYPQQDLAADMIIITEAAMELRGIRPDPAD